MRFIFAALIAIGINGMSYGQIEISTAILDIPDYHEKLNKLVSQQIIGYRVNTEFKTWDPFKPEDTKPWQVGHRVAVHGKEQWVSRNTIPLPSGDGKDYYVHVLSPDSCYYLQIRDHTVKNHAASLGF